jgi:hypothetical protein
MRENFFLGCLGSALLFGCGDDATPARDAGPIRADGGARDAAGFDAGEPADAGEIDAGGGTDAGAPVDACSLCVEGELTWGADGGLVPVREESSIVPCATYEHRTTMLGSGTMTMCTSMLSCEPRALIALPDVLSALANPDVQAALESPGVYGCDDRPVDGQVFRVEVSGTTIEIGSPCRPSGCIGAGGACREIPAGLTALRDLLLSLDEQEESSCM